jgi:Fungal chitosanase of glycosyl hydrolase group 75
MIGCAPSSNSQTVRGSVRRAPCHRVSAKRLKYPNENAPPYIPAERHVHPRHKIGEGSIRLHEMLSPPAPDPCAARDGNGFCQRILNASVEMDVLFFVFPGSAVSAGINQQNAEAMLQAKAAELFAALKGPMA